MTGDLITETLGYDGGRQVCVYLPPVAPEAVVFAGDGQLISPWGGVLEAPDLPPTMIVGVHRLADETLRLQEYSPGFDPDRFAKHERFFIVEDSPDTCGSDRFGRRAPRHPRQPATMIGWWRARRERRSGWQRHSADRIRPPAWPAAGFSRVSATYPLRDCRHR
jgi:hypothetical protein